MKIIKKILFILLFIICVIALTIIGASAYFIIINHVTSSDVYQYAQETNADYDSGLTGAIYVPTDSYNAYQMWRDYNSDQTEKDLNYAKSAGINSLRMFTSFEYWQENPNAFYQKFNDFIDRAYSNSIRILPILFEDCGVDNNEQTRNANTNEDGFCVCSPCREVQHNSNLWYQTDDYTKDFMSKYSDDKRLLAIEIMNEPHLLSGNVDFAKHELEVAKSQKQSVPLTMGQLTIFHNLLFAGMLDIYQYHDNFPNTQWRMNAEINIAKFFTWVTERPHWLTEWQRVRTSGGGWGASEIPDSDKTPDYASLSECICQNNICSFFWCLMIKPAYLPTQRSNGTFNGLFYKDGAPYSDNDLNAIKSLSINDTQPA